MSTYYDRQGNPIDLWGWAKLREDVDTIVVAQERVELADGRAAFVSTVWIGLNHNFSKHGPPLIFETMVFWESTPTGDDSDYQERYSTEADAVHGHGEAVTWVHAQDGAQA